MNNILDKLQNSKFWVGKGFEVPLDSTVEELFLGDTDEYIKLEVLIVAKRIHNQFIKCRSTRLVYQFVKEIQDTDYLFEGLELNPEVYWLYVECDDEEIPDIICSW